MGLTRIALKATKQRSPLFMTFPLNAKSTTCSLFANLEIALMARPVDTRPAIDPLLTTIEELAEATSLYPGTFREFKRCAAILNQAHEGKCGLSSDLKTFLENTVQRERKFGELRAPSSRMHLVASLQALPPNHFPPLRVVADKIMRLAALTGLCVGTWSQWDASFISYYPKMVHCEADLHAWVGFWESLDIRGALDERGLCNPFEDPFSDARWQQCERAIRSSIHLNCTSRLRSALEQMPHSSEPDSRGRHLQLLLNFLVAECQMSHRLTELSKRVKIACGELATSTISPKELGKTIRNILHEILHYSPEMSAHCEDEEFGLLIRVFTKINEVQRRFDLKNNSAIPKGGTQRIENGLAQLQKLQDYLSEVQKAYACKQRGQTIDYILRAIPPFLEITKCRLYYLKFCSEVCDILRAIHRQEEEGSCSIATEIFPTLKTLIRFFRLGGAAHQALALSAKLSDLFEKTLPAHREIYRVAWDELHHLERHVRKPRMRREVLKFQKILFGIEGLTPHLCLALSKDTLNRISDGETLSPSSSPSKRKALLNKPKVPKTELKPRKILTELTESSRDVTKSPPPTESPQSVTVERVTEKCAPFTYHDRVERWFHAFLPLDRERFPEYSTHKELYQRKMICLHGFTTIADTYCHRGINVSKRNTRFKAKGHQYILPAEFTFAGIRERGVIVWKVDMHQCCYHRFFHVKPTSEVIHKTTHKTFTDADFPEMGKSFEINARKKSDRPQARFSTTHCSVETDDVLQIVTLRDTRANTILKLYLVDECAE